MPHRVRDHGLIQPGPLAQRREQLVDRSRFHRRADRRPEQVDEHEVAHRRAADAGPFQHVLVVSLDHQAIHRHGAGMPRLRPGPVDVVPPHHMQVRAREITAQPGGINQEMDVLTAQADRFAAAQPRPAQQQHQKPVPGRTARPQQRHRRLVAGPARPGFRHLHPVACPHPQPPGAVLTAGLRRKAPAIRQLEQLTQHLHRGITLIDREAQEPAHRGQHGVDPPRAAYRHGPWPGHHRRRGRAAAGGSMPQPQDERPQLTCRSRPVPAGQPAPGQIQRYRAGVALSGRLGVITAEPHMPQVCIRHRDQPQLVINHCPVPDARRHPDQERVHPAIRLRPPTAPTSAT